MMTMKSNYWVCVSHSSSPLHDNFNCKNVFNCFDKGRLKEDLYNQKWNYPLWRYKNTRVLERSWWCWGKVKGWRRLRIDESARTYTSDWHPDNLLRMCCPFIVLFSCSSFPQREDTNGTCGSNTELWNRAYKPKVCKNGFHKYSTNQVEMEKKSSHTNSMYTFCAQESSICTRIRLITELSNKLEQLMLLEIPNI